MIKEPGGLSMSNEDNPVPPKGNYAVAASGLAKNFGDIRALADLSLQIPRGSTYCLLGPNGSGKTTLIRSIVGLVRLDRGEMYVLDEPVANVSKVYSRLGYMTQHRALYPDLTLEENMEFYAGLYGIEGRKRDERIIELLKWVDLTEHRSRLAGSLSGGMYQRLSLACTLIHEPDLLLLDEPTVGVDPRLRQAFWEYFDMLTAKGATILITTHLMDEAEQCKIVGYMREGKMQAEGSPEDIKRFAKLRPILRLWAENAALAAARLAGRGLEAKIVGENELQVILDDRGDIKDVLSEVRPLDLRLIEPTLGDAFLKLSEVHAA
jgi:ABC-2 type transport system ATP-binding protein